MKVKYLIIFLFAALYVKTSSAQDTVQKLEFELNAGLTTPLGVYHGGTAQTGASIGIEGRCNLSGTPWDCGLLLEITTARRGYNSLTEKNLDIWQSNRTLAFAATGSYNFRQGRKINPFAGIAIGIAMNDVVGDKVYQSKGTSLFFSPKIGVEFIHHLRLTVSSNFSRKGYNNLQLSLGVVIGGRPKKE